MTSAEKEKLSDKKAEELMETSQKSTRTSRLSLLSNGNPFDKNSVFRSAGGTSRGGNSQYGASGTSSVSSAFIRGNTDSGLGVRTHMVRKSSVWSADFNRSIGAGPYRRVRRPM